MGQSFLKRSELVRVLVLLGGVVSCACEGGWSPYQEAQGRQGGAAVHRHRSAPLPHHSSFQGHTGHTYSDGPSYNAFTGHHGAPTAFYPALHRQGHSFGAPSRYNNHFGGGYQQDHQDYQGFGPTSYSSLTGNHGALPEEHDGFAHSPIIITSSAIPHIVADSGPYNSGHISSIVTASPASLGPSHAGFLSASSSLRVADHYSKPSIDKGYKVMEDGSDEPHDNHSRHAASHPHQHRHHEAHPHSSNHNDRSSSHHPESKATSYQSFVLHSFKPSKVVAKKHHDGHHSDNTDSNEISHKH